MLRRLGVRAKVLAVLAVPMLVVLLAGAYISWQTVQNLSSEQNVRQIVAALTAYVPVNDALNDERAISQSGATVDQIAAARAKTDAAYATFMPALRAVNTSTYSSAVANAFGAVERAYTQDLPAARNTVDHPPAGAVGGQYSTFISYQLSLFDHLAQELSNRQVASYMSAYVSIGRTVSSLVQEQIDGTSLLARTEASVTVGQSYTALANQTEVYREAARTAVADLGVTGVQLPFSDPSPAFINDRAVLATGTPSQMTAVQPQAYLDDIAGQRTRLSVVVNNVLHVAETTSTGAITSAQQRAVLTIAVTALAAVASLIVALAVSRAIVVPLRRLMAAATDLREELPRLVEQVQVPGEGPQTSAPQIPVTSRDEVGRLAGAFNAVNATTFRVAQEQAALRGSIAEMFVNVARRDQVLLNRQLSFIDSLERTEEDPQTLANLFRLDHLATRMRRNAESLLVLAGIDSGRRLRDTLPLSDVVRTASSEIEQYDRVELDLQVDPHMLGFNALPAAHLLAELLENATVFSEPGTPIMVTTGVSGAFVEVRIFDEGLGMSEAELAAANAKIAATAVSDTLGAQRLGLYVVGRLAQRLSSEVVLRKNSTGPNGTETVVRFPASLFQSTESSPLGVYGDMSAATADDAPEVTEFDLSALTDGVTDQGLPRRRAGDAGTEGLPRRGVVRAAYDENAIMLPDVEASALPTDLSAGVSDWAPPQVRQGANLPSRQPAASAGPVPLADAAVPAAPTDAASRLGLFSAFRGRIDRPPLEDETVAAPAEPAEPTFVVPGLVPDDEPEDGMTWGDRRPVAEAAPQPATTDDSVPSWASWASNAPSWDEQPADYVPSAFAPESDEQAPQPAASMPQPRIPAQDTPHQTAAAAVAADPERWTPPEVDLAQWSVPEIELPTTSPGPDPFAAVGTWSARPADAVDEAAPYAPFERSLDEARAWATGAIPVVPGPDGVRGFVPVDAAAQAVAEPVRSAADVVGETADATGSGSEEWSLDGGMPELAPDVFAPFAAEAFAADDSTAVLAPVPVDPDRSGEQVDVPVPPLAAPAAEAPAEAFTLPVSSAWAPTAAESFSDVVSVPTPQQSPRRRGWFGRRKQQAPTATAVAVAPVAAVPVPAPPAPPVRSSALTASGHGDGPRAFSTRVPPPPVPSPVAPMPVPAPVAPAVAVPVSGSTTWTPQSAWNVPAGPTPPESSSDRSTPSWAAPEWAPRPTQSAEPEPPVSSVVEPTAAPRIGTLDDEVAAMLALRSDIQEQALSELSQLSSYRPQVVPGADRLTRRVPTAVPEAPEIVDSGAGRNPDEVRSRLASFQSGTARGRRDATQDAETS